MRARKNNQFQHNWWDEFTNTYHIKSNKLDYQLSLKPTQWDWTWFEEWNQILLHVEKENKKVKIKIRRETTTNNFGTRLQDKIAITIFKGGKEQSIP